MANFGDADNTIVGCFRSEYFVVEHKDYYVVEYLSPLKYSTPEYDTLFRAHALTDTFKGKSYILAVSRGNAWLFKQGDKFGRMRLKPADGEKLRSRLEKHNHFYYVGHTMAIMQHGRDLDKQDKQAYALFAQDRNMVYEKMSSLGIEAFKRYFNAFLDKYQIR